MKAVLTNYLSNGACWADFEFSVLLWLMLAGCPLLLSIIDVLTVSLGDSLIFLKDINPQLRHLHTSLLSCEFLFISFPSWSVSVL